MQLKTVGKLLRPFPYEPSNIELILSLYFDSRKPNSSCVGYSNLYLDLLHSKFV